MIRFASTETGATTTISIAGRLEANRLAELEEHCAEAQRTVVFDLTELRFADRRSIRWLSTRVQQGEQVLGASPYIKLRLERELDSRGHSSDQPTEE